MNKKKLGLLFGLLVTASVTNAQVPTAKKDDKIQFSLQCVREYTQGNWNMVVTALGKTAYIQTKFAGDPAKYYKTELLITNQYVYRFGKKDNPKTFWVISRDGKNVHYVENDDSGRSFPCVTGDFSQAEFNKLKDETAQYEKDNPPPAKEVYKPKI